ncbi:GntR family transcriptional regulator [Treponema sp. OttesenSCG-928-L16]|nr:GntR family transcriptional regulator [Treponema sp. OttesenSCG-928-L16]
MVKIKDNVKGGTKKKKAPLPSQSDNPKSIILTDETIYSISNNKDSLTKMIYEQLMSMFMNNELVPGQFLNRRKLAADLGVSVAPVLEALVQLELEGFIESVPRKGTIVSPVREEDVYERFILREALECTAARLYTGAPVRLHIDELRDYAEMMDTQGDTTFSHIKSEIIFHASLVNLAGLPSLTREYLRATRIGMFCMINRVSSRGRTRTQKHVELVEKLSTDNPDEAEKIVRDHLWSGKPVLRIPSKEN